MNVFRKQLIIWTWIRRFTYDSPRANQVARQWADVVSSAFAKGAYDHDEYTAAFYSIMGLKPKGGKRIDFVNFYPISIMQGCLNERIECAVVEVLTRYKYAVNKLDFVVDWLYANRNVNGKFS